MKSRLTAHVHPLVAWTAIFVAVAASVLTTSVTYAETTRTEPPKAAKPAPCNYATIPLCAAGVAPTKLEGNVCPSCRPPERKEGSATSTKPSNKDAAQTYSAAVKAANDAYQAAIKKAQADREAALKRAKAAFVAAGGKPETRK